MSQNIQIDTGEIRLQVNDDPDRVITFNPEDVLFVERFYNLIKTFEDREDDFLGQAKTLEEQTDVDEHGLPVALPGSMKLVREFCLFFRSQIDEVFGEGTSQAAFGDALTLNMFEQFFDAITPFIQSVRQKRTGAYTAKKQPKKKG